MSAIATLKARTMTMGTGTFAGAVTFGGALATTQWLGTTMQVAPPNNKIRYVNPGVTSPFGGPARLRITPMFGSGVKPSVAVTIFGVAGVPPPCAGAGCDAALIKAAPNGPQAIGGQAGVFVTTPGSNVTPPDLYNIVAGLTPKGTISAVVGPLGTGPAPTDMASSVGFFWTTGRITVSAPGAKGMPERFVLSGADNRGANGAGTIQLVAGTLSHRVTSGPNANRGWIRLNLKDASGPASFSQTFLVDGTPDGVKGWSWRIDIGGDAVASDTNLGPLPLNDGPVEFVDAFVPSINNNAGPSGCSATELLPPNGKSFRIDCPCDFEFWVADAAGPPAGECNVTQTSNQVLGSERAFNPTMVGIGNLVPALQPWGLLGALCSGLLLTGALMALLRRRRGGPHRA